MPEKELDILLIEENPDDMMLIKEHLSNLPGLPVKLTHCRNTDEARDFFLRGSASLILLSIKSPGRDELEIISRINEMAPSLPIVALINSDQREYGMETIGAGAEEYLFRDKFEAAVSVRTFLNSIGRKKREAGREESRVRYKELINLLPQLVFETDLKGAITFANNQAITRFGYDYQDYSDGLQALNIIAEEDRARAQANMAKSALGEKITDNEYTVIGKDGSRFPVLIYSQAIVQNGKPSGLRGVIVDITERKKAEQRIKSSEQKFNRAFHTSPIAMTIQDDNDIFIDVNDAFLEMTGYTREDIIGFPGSELSLWNNNDERIRAQEEFRQNGVLRNFEFKFRKKSGKIGIGVLWTEIFVIDRIKTVMTSTFEITDRKIAEEERDKSEQMYRNIFKFAPVGIYQSTVDGKFLRVNDRLVQILGYDSKDELMKCDLETDIYFKKEDRHKSIINFEKSGNIADLELCWKKKDGRPIWIQLTVSDVKDENGNTLFFDGFIRDISEKREAEFNLRENQKLLSTVIQNIPVGIFLIDKSGKISHANSAAQKIWGGVKYVGMENYEEYKGWYLDSGEKITAEQWGASRAILKGEQVINEEIEIETFDGKRKFLLHSAVPIRGSSKEITGAIVVNQDITQQRLVDLQVRRLSRAVEQSPVSVVITDTQGIIQYVNPKFEKVTGYISAEVIGKNPKFLKSGYTSVETYKEMWETITSGNEWRGEFNNLSKEGEKFWELSVISPIRNSSGKITNFLAVKEDITEQKKMTLELINAKERAEHSDNLKTEFLAQMSHEVRTPLNVLLSFSTYIKEELETRKQLTEDLDHYFDTVSMAGKRIIRTIELILNMSDVKSGSYAYTPVPTDICGDILRHVYYQYSQMIEDKNIRFEFVQNCEPVIVPADHYSVEQIFVQLISNAMKFTEKGFIKISADKNSSGNLVIKIEDSGIGIGGEYLEKLYTPFTQEDQGFSRTYEGNGLGLALAKKYCDLNEVLIEVESVKGEGTAFTLTFPNKSA